MQPPHNYYHTHNPHVAAQRAPQHVRFNPQLSTHTITPPYETRTRVPPIPTPHLQSSVRPHDHHTPHPVPVRPMDPFIPSQFLPPATPSTRRHRQTPQSRPPPLVIPQQPTRPHRNAPVSPTRHRDRSHRQRRSSNACVRCDPQLQPCAKPHRHPQPPPQWQQPYVKQDNSFQPKARATATTKLPPSIPYLTRNEKAPSTWRIDYEPPTGRPGPCNFVSRLANMYHAFTGMYIHH
jgi:hypothetical protein